MDPIQAKFLHWAAINFTWRGQDHREENEVGKSNTLPMVTEIEDVVPWPRSDAGPKRKQEIEKMKLTNHTGRNTTTNCPPWYKGADYTW